MSKLAFPQIKFNLKALVVGIFCTMIWFQSNSLYSQEIPAEFQIKRKENFEYNVPPGIKTIEENISIEFETKEFCDATIVIEDSDGNILRHLASGVLGKNAPEPFAKNSLSQKIIWDKKNDLGKYLDNYKELTVRVSLGLKPIFEKTLFWSPYKRVGTKPPVFAISEEGVFIFEGMGVDSLRKFNHNGEYEKTLYPFSKEAIKTVKDIQYEKFPQDGLVLPIKNGEKCKSTLFTFDNNKAHDKYGAGANVMAIKNKQIAMLCEGTSRMKTNGDSFEGGFKGPPAIFELPKRNSDAPLKIIPISAAFSNDGKWLYTTGYKVSTGYQAALDGHWLPIVMRTEYGSKEPGKIFIGEPDQKTSGSGPGQLKVPLAVIVDSENNILVADYMNDRIQIFSSEGKYIKEIKVEKPVSIGIHPKTKQLFVCSWMIVNDFIKTDKEQIPAKFTRFTSIDNPKVEFQCDLPFNEYNATTSWNRTGGLHFKVGFDFWAEEFRLWVLPGLPYTFGGWGVQIAKDDLKGTGIIVLQEKGKGLEIIRDFNSIVSKDIVRTKPAPLIRQRMFVHPKTGMLYLGEADSGVQKSFKQLVSINPKTSEIKLVDIPFTTEDLAIDLEGYFYLRTEYNVVRYEPTNWKEIPFDYGTEKSKIGFDDEKTANGISVIDLPATSKHGGWWHAGGFSVSPRGDIAVTTYNSATRNSQVPTGSENYYTKGSKNTKKKSYSPDIYPGREVDFEIHIWDKFGKIKYQDAFPGVTATNGIFLDKDDNLFVMMDQNKMVGDKPYFLNWGSTMVKVKAGKAKVLSVEKNIPLPLPVASRPNRTQDIAGGWIENVEWLYGGVGFSGWRSGASCICWNTRPAVDLFSRVFAPEIDHYSVAVLDSNGNLILRIGQYGNVDDGKPLIAEGGPKNPISIGGDEVALFHAPYLATFTDHQLFISDGGNSRIVSVKLDYHNTQKFPLK